MSSIGKVLLVDAFERSGSLRLRIAEADKRGGRLCRLAAAPARAPGDSGCKVELQLACAIYP